MKGSRPFLPSGNVLFIGKDIWQVEIETVCCSFQNLFREKIVLDITKNCGWSRTFNS
jgi:hypothetical protein